jgi:hypothetical protein
MPRPLAPSLSEKGSGCVACCCVHEVLEEAARHAISRCNSEGEVCSVVANGIPKNWTVVSHCEGDGVGTQGVNLDRVLDRAENGVKGVIRI